MAFQSTIRQFPTDGFVGDFALDGPVRSQSVLLQSSDATQNVIGRAVTMVAGTTDGLAVAGGSGVFGGILTNSKQYASIGGSSGPLSPTLTLPNNLPAQATTTAPGIWVSSLTAANVGDQVCYKVSTGEIGAANGQALPAPVQAATSTSTSGGTLAAATYYYKVTALNANGETIGSNEQSQTTTGSTSSNVITWAAVTGATGYRIYRGTAAGLENVFYTVGAVTTYTDTNAASTNGTPPAVNTTTAAPSGYTLIPGAYFVRYSIPSAGLAMIELLNS